MLVKFNILNEISNLLKLYRVTYDSIIVRTDAHTERGRCEQKHLNILHIYDIFNHVIFTA